MGSTIMYMEGGELNFTWLDITSNVSNIDYKPAYIGNLFQKYCYNNKTAS